MIGLFELGTYWGRTEGKKEEAEWNWLLWVREGREEEEEEVEERKGREEEEDEEIWFLFWLLEEELRPFIWAISSSVKPNVFELTEVTEARGCGVTAINSKG